MVKSRFFNLILGGIIKTDLDYVVNNLKSQGCDLWEEIRSNDFFWNLMAYRHTLKKASDFAKSEGESDLAKAFNAALISI